MATALAPIPDTETERLVELLRDLIRIPSVNPPGGEIEVARYLERLFAEAGLPSQVFEPFPGRGTIVARLRGDGTGGDPLLLLSHLDVVPADPAGWSHPPFAADLADGYVWGRGAVDMKAMVAMEVAIMRRLCARARAAGLDPAADPVPGLHRDVIFAGTADEEAGGWQGAGWLVENHPDLLRAAGALNEAGGIGMEFAGARFFPIQVAEKGFVVYTLTIHGVWGHGSIPTDENAAVWAARVVDRLSRPGPARITPTIAAALTAALPHLPAKTIGNLAAPKGGRPAGVAAGIAPALKRLPKGVIRRLVARVTHDPERIDGALDRLCEPSLARVGHALLHDTISPDVIRAGVKYNQIPGVAEIELDCRILPGTTVEGMTAELRRRIGEDIWPRVEVHVDQTGAAVEASVQSPLYRLLERTIRDADHRAVPVPALVPYATDAKHLAKIGVPCFGFSPLQMSAKDNFLTLMHGDDERVGVDGLRWGYGVLVEAVRRFCE